MLCNPGLYIEDTAYANSEMKTDQHGYRSEYKMDEYMLT